MGRLLFITFVAIGALTIAEGPGRGQLLTTAVSKKRPHPLAGIASIIEADVVSSRYLYSDDAGPRTEITIANVVVHYGPTPRTLTFTQYGGPLPDGSFAAALELPVLHPGARYILFLTRHPWFYTPVWSRLAFRLETVEGKTIVVGPDGFAVTSFSAEGVSFGTRAVIDYAKVSDPLAPLGRNKALVSADVIDSAQHDTFVAAIKSAMTQMAFSSVSDVPLMQSNGGLKWNVKATSPALPEQ